MDAVILLLNAKKETKRKQNTITYALIYAEEMYLYKFKK